MDYYWFKAVGFLQVFMVNLQTQLALLFGAWIVTTVCLILAWRSISNSLGEQIPELGGTLFKVFSVFIGFGVGWWFKGEYLTVLKFMNHVSWGVIDPIFQNDVSFYVFTLPFIRSVLSFAAVISGIVLLLSIFTYVGGRIAIETQKGEVDFTSEASFSNITQFLKSWPIIGSIGVLTVVGAAFIWLGRFSFLWSFNPGASVPVEASYMAVHYLIPYTWVKAFGALLFGGLVIYSLMNLRDIRERLEFGNVGALKREGGVLVAVFLIFVIGPLIFGVINTVSVQPNEPTIQEEYIEAGIEYTNKAYDLKDIKKVSYPVKSENLSENEALSSSTIRNARIVDYKPTKKYYEQNQELRQYYSFNNVDVDRYDIENQKKLVVISGREISAGELPQEGGEWQNQHLIYTHGFGAAASPANKVEPSGAPIMKIKSVPPENEWKGLGIKEPRIYFGEITDHYAIVKASGIKEFDYPSDPDVRNTYKPDRGIKIGNPWKKLITWFYTGDFKVLVSRYVGEDSRLLLHRNIHKRVKKIAPFLNYDPNAHLFIDQDGGLRYLLNGVSHAERYPYSYTSGRAPGYLSDSVKAFVKSNTGDVQFYIQDKNDPIAQTFSRIYPNLFVENEMPDVYKKHLIYPESLFDTQMKIFERYHIKDYQTFYYQEDLWTPALERYESGQTRIEPYNILFDVSGRKGFENKKEEFTLVKTFTPPGKTKMNLRAWVGVAQDPANYGKFIALTFPKGKFVPGPLQVESFIDQEENISEQLTLWDRAGSRVLRGNLLVLPVENDLLYIEPIYLSAEADALPMMKRVIAGYGEEVRMEENLTNAVRSVLRRRRVPTIPRENIAPIENMVKPLYQTVQRYLALRNEYNQLIGQGEYRQAGLVRENMAKLEENMAGIIERWELEE